MAKSSDNLMFFTTVAILGFFLSFSVIIGIFATIEFLYPGSLVVGILAIFIGLALIVLGYLTLVIVLPIASKNRDVSINIVSLKTSYTLVIGGLIILLLGFLSLMKVIPWWT